MNDAKKETRSNNNRLPYKHRADTYMYTTGQPYSCQGRYLLKERMTRCVYALPCYEFFSPWKNYLYYWR